MLKFKKCCCRSPDLRLPLFILSFYSAVGQSLSRLVGATDSNVSFFKVTNNMAEKIKRAGTQLLHAKNRKRDQLSAASFFLSGKPIAAASFTS